jgi:hypothetical protein
MDPEEEKKYGRLFQQITNRVVPRALKVSAQGGTVTAELPPLSVATILVKLA